MDDIFDAQNPSDSSLQIAELALSHHFMLSGLINLLITLILLRFIYYKHSPNREMLFGFYLFANGVFVVTALLHNVQMSTGFALGLFAVFSMLRYRTESIDIRDMTYLFISIVIALIFAVAPLSIFSALIIGLFICGLTATCESYFFAPKVFENKVVYDRVDNLTPECRHQLIEDLSQRTGLNIIKVQLGEIDYLKESVSIKIFYTE